MSNFERFPGQQPGQIDLPDFGKLFRENKSRLGMVVAALVVIAGIATSFYQVQPDEVGVVLRFGKHIGNTQPGPHFRLPFGLDQVIKVPVERQQKLEFGFRTERAGIRSEVERNRTTAAESEMLTGDFNVSLVEWIVQYKIADPAKYLFNFRDIETTLRLMSEATMRTVIGDHSIDEVITGGREAVELQAKDAFIALNKRYDTGILVQQLKLQDVNVAEPVRPALREVEEAKQEKERAINQAKMEYNKVIPLASGRAEQLIQESKGYAIERTNEAKGDAERFRALYVEYRKAPEVTRTRLYLESLAEILPKAQKKIIMDSNAKGLVPLLQLAEGAK